VNRSPYTVRSLSPTPADVFAASVLHAASTNNREHSLVNKKLIIQTHFKTTQVRQHHIYEKINQLAPYVWGWSTSYKYKHTHTHTLGFVKLAIFL